MEQDQNLNLENISNDQIEATTLLTKLLLLITPLNNKNMEEQADTFKKTLSNKEKDKYLV